MRRTMSDWEQEAEDRPVVTTLKFWFWTVAIVVVTGVAVTAALWVTGVATAPWKGKGDAYQEKHSSGNWVAAQRAFHQQYNDVQGYKAKIAAAKQELAAVQAQYPTSNGTPYDPGAQQVANARATLTGLTQQCQNTVTGYNTDAQSYLTQDFRDAGLPERLDPAECAVPAG